MIPLQSEAAKSRKWTGELMNFVRFLRSEMRPKGPLFTPFNLAAGLIVAAGAVLIVIRFIFGIGSITNLTQEFPWGLWIGFDVMTGVAFAGGAYVITFMVYVMRMDKYHSIVRITVLNGFLAYVFYAGALLLDLGRPWNVINPIIGNKFGVSSVLFLVAWHFMLYMAAQFIEFSPAVAEWIGLKKARKILGRLTLASVIFGITLSTLHQSGLGALFLMAKSKIHPLWYSEFIPILFFVSSIFAGLSMVIFEGSISRKVFAARLDGKEPDNHHAIVIGLSRICAGTMFAYLFLKAMVLIHSRQWALLNTPWGALFLLETVGLVLLPLVLFALAVKKENTLIARWASGFTLLGILLNRLNISVIAFNWQVVPRYIPSWMEVVVSLSVVAVELMVVRWVVNRMPVLGEAPAWAKEQDVTPAYTLNPPVRQVNIIGKKESAQWTV